MININNSVENFIREYIDFIEQDNWTIIYIDIDPMITGAFTKVMLDAGINPLNGMTEIPEDFLRGQKDVTEFTIPDNISRIGNNAFFNCGLKQVNIPNSCYQLGVGCFERNQDLEYVKLPTTLEKIEHFVFSDCPNLKTIECEGTRKQFMDGLMISVTAFADCSTHIIHCSDGDLIEKSGSLYYV